MCEQLLGFRFSLTLRLLLFYFMRRVFFPQSKKTHHQFLSNPWLNGSPSQNRSSESQNDVPVSFEKKIHIIIRFSFAFMFDFLQSLSIHPRFLSLSTSFSLYKDRCSIHAVFNSSHNSSFVIVMFKVSIYILKFLIYVWFLCLVYFLILSCLLFDMIYSCALQLFD